MREAAATLHSLGALVAGGATTFRVWAPDYESIELVLDSSLTPAAVRPLWRDPAGYWSGRFEDVKPGARYRFRIDRDPARTFPDPASRFQPDGVHGPSQVVDPAAFAWTDGAFAPPPLDRLVIYELHVGTFTPEGTFRSAIDRLPHLAALGVTAIELMPVADFPGQRNWGYDGVALYAPARCYGHPDDLRALVDAAHREGIAVILDVVYNHFGPDGAYANVFSAHYFTEAHRSPWGKGVNLDGERSRDVRRFFIENALYWIGDFHIDGLRLDATHALQDNGSPHFLAELASTIRDEARRPVSLFAEDHRNLQALGRPVSSGGMGFDGIWADDFHHQARVHTAGDREGYYADFTGTMRDLAKTLREGWFFRGEVSHYLGHARGTDPSPLQPRQFVICLQNHDQVGNRADGARLHHEIDFAAYRALTSLLLLAPQTPLLFMGQEWAATPPFLFFTDHHEELGRQVTAGRREEFSAFSDFSDAALRSLIPDPQAAETFLWSVLRWHELDREPHAHVLRLYRRLLEIRRTNAAWGARGRDSYQVEPLDDHTLALGFLDDPWLLIARLSGGPESIHLSVSGSVNVVLTTEDEAFVADPTPLRVREGLHVDFERPGAVLLHGLRIARFR